VDRRLVLASANPGKVRELRALLAGLGADLITLSDLGVAGAEEAHATFVENALAKARHAAGASGLPALADDSGLCCEALDGAPGVFSARFAGADAGDKRNRAELLRRLAGCSDRRAHFTCVLVAVRAPADPDPVIADGRWSGVIVEQAEGNNGFGYDPIFRDPETGRTAAQLAPAEKNRLSHRGQAMRELERKLRQRWSW
jgi:XTP/dITP diphosphohydrolase